MEPVWTDPIKPDGWVLAVMCLGSFLLGVGIVAVAVALLEILG